MSQRDIRKKASDIFRESTPFFGQKVDFDKAFPQIKDLTVEVIEYGDGIYNSQSKSIYNRGNLPGEYVNCSNPLCYNGGFSLGGILREMVRNKQTILETSKSCKGYEGSPKGRRKYGPCMNCFNIKAAIQYQ